MDEELLNNLKELLEHLLELRGTLDVEAKCAEIQEVEKKMSKPGFWESGQQDKVIQRLKSLKNAVEPVIETEKQLEDAVVLAELALSEEDEATFEEARNEHTKLRKAVRRIEMAALLGEQHDAKNCFVYVHAGAGGIDS
jgi:peptide chain release factor 2